MLHVHNRRIYWQIRRITHESINSVLTTRQHSRSENLHHSTYLQISSMLSSQISCQDYFCWVPNVVKISWTMAGVLQGEDLQYCNFRLEFLPQNLKSSHFCNAEYIWQISWHWTRSLWKNHIKATKQQTLETTIPPGGDNKDDSWNTRYNTWQTDQNNFRLRSKINLSLSKVTLFYCTNQCSAWIMP